MHGRPIVAQEGRTDGYDGWTDYGGPGMCAVNEVTNGRTMVAQEGRSDVTDGRTKVTQEGRT